LAEYFVWGCGKVTGVSALGFSDIENCPTQAKS
jgi:hypothetical protein